MEFDVPGLVAPTTLGSLGMLPTRNAESDPERIGFADRTEDGGWLEVSNAEFAGRVDRLARGFLAAGVGSGDRIALMAPNSLQWTVIDFALWSVGAVVVPVPSGASGGAARWILSDSGAVAVVVHGQDAATVAQVRPDLPELRDVWTFGSADVVDALDELSQGAEELTAAELRARTGSLDRDSPATVVYTSGTTDQPRGVLLTHGNFMTLAQNTTERLSELVERPDACTIVVLPLSHVLPRFIQVVSVLGQVRLGHSADMVTGADDIATFRPTFLLVVPHLLERLLGQVEQRAQGDGQGRLFAAAVRSAQQWSLRLDQGRSPSPLSRARRAIFDRTVHRRLHEALGGRVQALLCGGAPLSDALAHTFRGFGLPVLEGYGLTETTGSATVNTLQLNRVGTVGAPLPGTAVRIGEDGAVMIRGVGVMQGYWHDEPATRAVIDADGWLTTGDLGVLDEHGFLRITGRAVDLLITSDGTRVNPAALERELNTAPLVSHSIVVGEARAHLAALIALDPDALHLWSDNNGLERMDLREAAQDPRVHAEIGRAVKRLNALSPTMSVRAFRVLPGPLSPATGHITGGGKLRRGLVAHDYADEIEALYVDPVDVEGPARPGDRTNDAANHRR